jgi:hypothetical protein
MSINIPQNNIVYNYTAGKEYLVLSTYKEYIGYYYKVNDTFFAGESFDVNAPELVKIGSNRINKLLENPLTSLYGEISNLTLNSETPTSFIFNNESNTRYFIYQINKNLIKEINEDTFKIFQNNPLYISVKLDFTSGFNEQELDAAEKKIPGIKAFVDISYVSSLEENNEITGYMLSKILSIS